VTAYCGGKNDMPPTPYDQMINQILPDLVQRFRKKSADYGEVFRDLGIPGQYSDMHRKMHKLRRGMWEEEQLKGEPVEEILSDLFGNILISLYLIDEELRTSEVLPGVRSPGRTEEHDRTMPMVRSTEGQETLQLQGKNDPGTEEKTPGKSGR
jgi:hypothetical protein